MSIDDEQLCFDNIETLYKNNTWQTPIKNYIDKCISNVVDYYGPMFNNQIIDEKNTSAEAKNLIEFKNVNEKGELHGLHATYDYNNGFKNNYPFNNRFHNTKIINYGKFFSNKNRRLYSWDIDTNKEIHFLKYYDNGTINGPDISTFVSATGKTKKIRIVGYDMNKKIGCCLVEEINKSQTFEFGDYMIHYFVYVKENGNIVKIDKDNMADYEYYDDSIFRKIYITKCDMYYGACITIDNYNNISDVKYYKENLNIEDIYNKQLPSHYAAFGNIYSDGIKLNLRKIILSNDKKYYICISFQSESETTIMRVINMKSICVFSCGYREGTILGELTNNFLDINKLMKLY